MERSKLVTIKSKTNHNEFAKQRFCFIRKSPEDTALVIEKNILSENDESATYFKKFGYTKLRTYKGKTLYRQIFSIKASTMNQALKELTNQKL